MVVFVLLVAVVVLVVVVAVHGCTGCGSCTKKVVHCLQPPPHSPVEYLRKKVVRSVAARASYNVIEVCSQYIVPFIYCRALSELFTANIGES